MKYLFLILLPTIACAGTHIQSGDTAGGSLTGTYPNPTLAAGAVTLQSSGVGFGSSISTPTTNVDRFSFDNSTYELIVGTTSIGMAGTTGGFYGSGFRGYSDGNNTPFFSGSSTSYVPFASLIGTPFSGKVASFVHEDTGRFYLTSNRNLSMVSNVFIFPTTHTSEFEVMYDSITAKTPQFSITTGGSANKAMCWKADGMTLGYCSTVVGIGGDCTCN